jgi:DNA mismatch repair protein MutS
MLQQYFEAKRAHPGVLMAMRVGDFYEFYGEDAEIAAAALEITLTGREDGANGRIAMAGVPFHSVEKYLTRLIQKGMKVALCDQIEDPKQAKGLVRRAVTRVLTPGTLVEDAMLPAERNNFLAAVCVQGGRAGLATLDPSTGEFLVTEIEREGLEQAVLQELARLLPSELLLPDDMERLRLLAADSLGIAVTASQPPDAERAEQTLLRQFHVRSLEGFGCAGRACATIAASMVIAYAERSGLPLAHVGGLASYSIDGFMTLDVSTRRSLELTQNLADGGRAYTLLSILDNTRTPMGARLLRRWIEQPLLEAGPIRARHQAVARLVEATLPRADVAEVLGRVSDMERLVSRAATGLAGPRDLAALRATLVALPQLEEPLRRVGFGRLAELSSQIVDHRDLAGKLASALVPEPPHALRDGGVIREGHDAELDKLRSLSRDGRAYIAALEAAERERTGISSLKVGFNSVFGYYLEVSKANADRVPEHYIRKQTTANAERYITAELKEHESAVLGAHEKAIALEGELFHALRAQVAEHARSLLQTARAIAEIDVLASLAEVAVRRRYVRPEVVDEDVLELTGARHPVVEAHNAAFVANDLALGSTRLAILTGPNMSGKSTYLRQTALCVLMAQIGSFVPAERCRLGLCDRIFARIGAKDELALGQSTFMVEMVESANILNHAGPRSLVILDEVGRGTSTYDGLAIAWAMVERLAEIGAKTMFATHYHQLNALAEQIPEVANFRVEVREIGDDVVWTHRVLPGGTDRSYGIHVARMAGVPPSVLRRASEVLAELERSEPPHAAPTATRRMQLTLFEADDPAVVRELQELDVNALTPVQALVLLEDWKRRFGG